MKKELCWLVSALLVAAASYADTKTWDGGASGSWTTGTNWDPDGVPLAADEGKRGSRCRNRERTSFACVPICAQLLLVTAEDRRLQGQ